MKGIRAQKPSSRKYHAVSKLPIPDTLCYLLSVPGRLSRGLFMSFDDPFESFHPVHRDADEPVLSGNVKFRVIKK